MDKRIINSNKKIKDTYIEMLMKQEPNKIQVKELCKLAHINRSTFYDRYGFLENLENEIIEDEMKRFSFGETQIDQLEQENDGIHKEIIKRYFEAFCNNKILVRFCTIGNREKYVDIIAHKQVNLCASSLTKITYYEAYFQCLGALTTIIEWMNDNKGHTLDDIVDIVYNHSIAMFKKWR